MEYDGFFENIPDNVVQSVPNFAHPLKQFNESINIKIL